MHAAWGEIDRRLLIQLGTAGLAALALPGAARAAMAQGFTHGVASGEPGAHSVLLWTRYAAANDTALTAELSESADFARVAGGGSVTAAGERDHTAKITVDGLEPGLRYALWAIAGDTPIPAGLFVPDDGSIDDAVELDDVAADAWGITIEPETGSDAPTPPIIYFAET